MDVILENIEIRLGEFCLAADLTVESGSTAIIGPSGGGKSTLLLAVAGFVAPVVGKVLFDGQNLTTAPPAERLVTMLFQENNLFPHLPVFQNVALGIRPDLKLSSTQKDRVRDALVRVGLPDMEERYPTDLSGGQRQRVALARALLRDKPVLLLDEPFAALGPALRYEMLDLVAEIREQQDATLLLVTHTPEDARRIADKTILVAEGRAMPPAPTAVLLDNPPPALAEYLGSP